MIKQADEKDMRIVEEILLDAVDWMTQNGIQNQWDKSNINRSYLFQYYRATDFYIAYENAIPTACMAITDHDPTYWPSIKKGESLYLHKVAVKRAFAGKGFSKELIDFAKNLAQERNINAIRLNCNKYRNRLRAVYEKEGFVCVEEKNFSGEYDTALYVYYIT